MRKTWAILLILLLAFSCKDNKIDRPPKPDNLLSKDQMVEVLYDMALISSAKGINKKILENKGVAPEQYVYQKHNIDSLQFAQSNNYYAFDLKTYQALYNRVRAKLQKDKQRFRAELEEDKRIQDSISERNRRRRDSIIREATLDATEGLE